jgi:hypothetical protein
MVALSVARAFLSSGRTSVKVRMAAVFWCTTVPSRAFPAHQLITKYHIPLTMQ